MPDRGAESDQPNGSSQLEDAMQRLFRDGRLNAVLSWLLIPLVVVVFIESVLDLDYQWAVFVGLVGVIVLIPPLAYREWRVMLPWEVLLLALFPIIVRALFGGAVGTFASYLALAALALLVVVELHIFTTLNVTHWFAVGIVVMATLAAVAVWTVFRWNADRVLGTAYLVDNETLMLEWLSVTFAGLAAGILFDGYFRRRDRLLWRAIRRMVGR